MPALKGGGKTLKRQPSLKGSLVFYIWKGQFVASPWPKKRGKPKSATTRAQNEWFRKCQWATKYWPAASQIACADAVSGTALLPRDLMTMIMAGRCYMLTFKDGRKMYSKAMVSDVSASLDVISQQPGGMMYRGDQLWSPIAPGSANMVLTLAADGKTPVWKASGGSGGTWAFQPPAAVDFPIYVTGDFEDCTLVDDAFAGLQWTYGTPVNTGAFRGAFKELPDGDWSVTALFTQTSQYLNFASFGITVLELSTNKCLSALQYGDTNSLAQARQHTMAGGYTTDTKRLLQPSTWARISRAGGDIVIEQSNDGRSWAAWRTSAIASLFTVGPTHIGLCGSCQSTSFSPSVYGSCQYWQQDW